MARPTSLRRIFLRLRAKAAKRDGKAGRAGSRIDLAEAEATLREQGDYAEGL